MRPKSRTRSSGDGDCGVGNGADRVIAALAARQCGVVGREQLLTAGIDGGAIKRRIRARRLHPIHRGVYLVGHPVPVHGAREMAAVLACGAGAVVSHRSAANLWQLLPYPANPPPVDITVAGRDAGVRRGIRAHRVRTLDQRDTRRVGRVPATSAARTLLDLAGVLPTSELERAIAEAQVRRLVRKRDLADQLERNPGRPGTRALRRLLDVEGGPAFTRSKAERRMLRLVRAAELPVPRVNSRLERYEVDFLWPDHKLVVEFDSFRFHSPRARFERDRERDAVLAAAGYTVIRVTWRQLVDAPEAVAARIAAALAVRS
jgi:very-short-patch-repair endonuclease